MNQKQFKANGEVFEVGCVWKDKRNRFRRVDYVGENRIICARLRTTLEEAENTKYSGSDWTKEELKGDNTEVVAYKKCGIDKNGDVVRQYDEVECYGVNHTVLGFIDSYNDDGYDYFIIADKECGGGWGSHRKFDCTLIKPKEKKEEPMVEINGKKFSESTIQEALKRYVGE